MDSEKSVAFVAPPLSEKSSMGGGSVNAGSGEDLVKMKANWSNPIEFILSCLNFALGLGNVWRYPYLAYRNGGGAFLIPYFLAAVLIGLPLFFIELLTGQYSGVGPIKAFQFLSPLFKGLGYCTVVIVILMETYYMVIVGWCFFYFYQSFFPSLKWGSCDNSWNSPYCNSLVQDLKCQEGNVGNFTDQIYFNRTCRTVESICTQFLYSPADGTNCRNSTGSLIPIPQVIPRVFSSEEFFFEHTLGIDGATWSDWGLPRVQTLVPLFIAWMLCALAIVKGVQSMGKIVYFTATFPFIIITAIFIRGLTLPGSFEGIKFYVTPQWERLASAGVWGDASSQIFYSFSLGIGALITLASHNKFRNNFHFDSMFVCIVNFCTAFYAGLAVFSILGFLAHTINVPVGNVVASGPGLSFVTFPEAILLMPASQVWAILFFFMMIVLGLGSTFAVVHLVTTSILDNWPNLRKDEWKVTFAVAFTGFLLGIPQTCPGGIYLFTLLEWHTVSWNILLVGFCEVIIFSWVYGFDNTFELVNEMGVKIFDGLKKYYWKPILMFIAPIYSLGIFIFILTGVKRTQFRDYVFPVWADTLGWLFGAFTVVPFFVFAIIEGKKHNWNFREMLKPTKNWGPQEDSDGNRIDRSRLG